ncbi:MAG: hypothetical protein ACR2RL_21800 [Gammaproteobacteria bacterium]
MPSVTFAQFDGVDLRKGHAVTSPNHLRVADNARITTGKALASRPGLALAAELPADAISLWSGLGALNVFSTVPIAGLSTPFINRLVPHPNGGVALADVHFADVFNGALYVVAEYANADVFHHFLDDSAPEVILDSNNPRSAAVAIAAGKVFAVGPDDTVRFSATNRASDWSAVDDAGFLPSGLQANGDPQPLALGHHRGRLAVIQRDSVQTWQVDPDPAKHQFIEEVDNIGTAYPRTVHRVAGDLFFLSDYGVRSVSQQQVTQSLQETDIGSPVDEDIKAVLAASSAEPIAIYYHGLGQYVLAIGPQVFAYTYSRTAKISAWSRYTLPGDVTAMAELNGELYLRAGNAVYRFDESSGADVGEPMTTRIVTAYLDFKKPSRLKHLTGFDAVMQGGAQVSFLYDERDEARKTDPMYVDGITHPGALYPVDVLCTAVAVEFRHQDVTPFRLDSFTLHYEELGTV